MSGRPSFPQRKGLFYFLSGIWEADRHAKAEKSRPALFRFCPYGSL
ncbi:hypothetical protein BN871_DF_00340 [Paenibacillus sp. P22]|nr:hypothetical protein BN871_DF_00340 [Paenibacillus sp. P22]